MRNRSALFAGFFAGLAAPAAAFKKPDYARAPASDLARMRGDMMRISEDFSKVITREHGKIQKYPAK